MNKQIVIEAWDNGGKTIDRYSVAISGLMQVDKEPYTFWLGANDEPFHPQGYGMHCGEIQTREYKAQRGGWRHLGKRVSWWNLPEQVQQFILQEFKS